MAVPRNRHSNARKNSRRAHHALSKKQTLKCECGARKLPHTLCRSCGAYGNGLNYGSENEQE